jgi:hypothetical protein
MLSQILHKKKLTNMRRRKCSMEPPQGEFL